MVSRGTLLRRHPQLCRRAGRTRPAAVAKRARICATRRSQTVALIVGGLAWRSRSGPTRHTVQSTTSRPGTRANSRVLFVTTASPRTVRARRSTRRSPRWGCRPRSSARISPACSAAAVVKGRTEARARNCSTTARSVAQQRPGQKRTAGARLCGRRHVAGCVGVRVFSLASTPGWMSGRGVGVAAPQVERVGSAR